VVYIITSLLKEYMPYSWRCFSSQEIQQHDVQELNRVLFDALAKSFVNSPSQSMLSDLYTGTTVTLTQCLSCGYSSEVRLIGLSVLVAVKRAC
jgi:ubiquitin carboxyl-terminal hydrolase 40